jgi:hypothetical protein
MARTCIICGGPAGSGEHVFPASLGGRRTNKGIYCTIHDNGYSSLVAELAGQLDVFNSMLGVRPDHSDDVKSVRAHDKNTGQEIDLSVKTSRFTKPRIVSNKPFEDGAILNMHFSDHESVTTWIAEQEAKGIKVVVQGKGVASTYFLGPVHFTRKFGGANGLGAVAYVAQTFLAQAFPELARSPSLADFKNYTQIMATEAKASLKTSVEANMKPSAWTNDAPVWWDFDPQPDQTPNAFPFGHRVMVGVDAVDGLIHGRISFFSSLHFSMIFGVAPNDMATKAVTIDIDPLAEHPPRDILKTEMVVATARVSRPASQTAGLASAIAGNMPEKIFADLLQRMTDHSLARTASEMSKELIKAANFSSEDAELHIAAVLEVRSQRVWNLARWFVEHFKESPQGESLRPLWPQLDALVADDVALANGLSPAATQSLELAKKALLAEMIKDYWDGGLGERRLAELMGEGPGAAVVGAAIIQPLLLSLPK